MAVSNVPFQHANLVEALMFGLHQIKSSPLWLVVVTPDENLDLCRRLLIGVIPSDVKFSGRTARFPGGGSFSVMPSSEAVSVPSGTPFTVMFVGWGDSLKANMADMLRWKAAATQVVSKVDND